MMLDKAEGEESVVQLLLLVSLVLVLTVTALPFQAQL